MGLAGSAHAQFPSAPVLTTGSFNAQGPWGTTTVAHDGVDPVGVFFNINPSGYAVASASFASPFAVSDIGPHGTEPYNPDAAGKTVVWADYYLNRIARFDFGTATFSYVTASTADVRDFPSVGRVDSGGSTKEWIAWQHHSLSGGDWDIEYYDPTAGGLNTLTRPGDQTRPSVSNGRIAYSSDGTLEIYNIGTSVTSVVATPPATTSFVRPNLSGNYVAYEVSPLGGLNSVAIRQLGLPYSFAPPMGFCDSFHQPRIDSDVGLVVYWGKKCVGLSAPDVDAIFVAKFPGGVVPYLIAEFRPVP